MSGTADNKGGVLVSRMTCDSVSVCLCMFRSPGPGPAHKHEPSPSSGTALQSTVVHVVARMVQEGAWVPDLPGQSPGMGLCSQR